jgi:predicted dinucleotide-binding enzyme
MRIGIIGAGHIGGTLARLFAARGHQVSLANSRGPQTLTDLVAEISQGVGGSVVAADVRGAASAGEVVVVSIPLGRYPELPADAFAPGTIVIDTNNYYPQRDGRIPDLEDGRTTSSELLAAHLPDARVVKAFNAIYSAWLRDRGSPDATESGRLAIPIAGDDPAAKETVSRLIREIGFAPVDAGSLAQSRRFQPGTPVYGADANAEKAADLLKRAG